MVRRVARGSTLRTDGLVIEVLWPPATARRSPENERSLVARSVLPTGRVLITSDIGRMTEKGLSRLGGLRSELLLAPHHGSRGSFSQSLIEAATPQLVLIPAASRNVHGHPHPEVLERLDGLGIPYRYPARDGRCGARPKDGRWVLYP
jgi:competence protein ComEC